MFNPYANATPAPPAPSSSACGARPAPVRSSNGGAGGGAGSASSSGARRGPSRAVRGVGIAPGADTAKPSTPATTDAKRPPATVIAKVNEVSLNKVVQSSMASGLKNGLVGATKVAISNAMKQPDVVASMVSALKGSLKAHTAQQKQDMLKSATEAATAGVTKAVTGPVKLLDKVWLNDAEEYICAFGV